MDLTVVLALQEGAVDFHHDRSCGGIAQCPEAKGLPYRSRLPEGGRFGFPRGIVASAVLPEVLLDYDILRRFLRIRILAIGIMDVGDGTVIRQGHDDSP